jgi:hypothetical protein
MPSSGNAELKICDLAGKTVFSASIDDLIPGEKRTIRFNENLLPGIYVATCTQGKYQHAIKLVKVQ